ncbi:MAG TPA: hypothetical protein VGN88_06985 [Phycisphaerae bacterium]
MDTDHRPFKYLADPVCIVALTSYAFDRFLLRPHGIQNAFTQSYLNDLLCLPLFVPIILYAQHLLGLRPHFSPPRLWEILHIWLVFSILFEVILPRFPTIFRTTADPWDVVAYLTGGALGACAWCRCITPSLLRDHASDLSTFRRR